MKGSYRKVAQEGQEDLVTFDERDKRLQELVEKYPKFSVVKEICAHVSGITNVWSKRNVVEQAFEKVEDLLKKL